MGKEIELNLLLIRGVSGAGKSELAKLISNEVFAADDYFMKNEEYKFDVSKLGAAHLECQTRTENAMKAKQPMIVVANTFTTKWEMKKYFELATKYSYRVFSIITENRHEGVSVHDVPEKTLEKQKSRFDVKL